MSLEHARRLADAVMMEGYTLYPYRPSAVKNRYRWTFGVLAPRAWSEAGGCEPWWLETQLLVAGAPTQLTGELRFFHVERRPVAGGGTWDEGVARSVGFPVPGAGQARDATIAFRFAGGAHIAEVAGQIVLRYEPIERADQPLARVTIRVENVTPWHDPSASRDRALACAFAATHLLVSAEAGELLSAIDPPEWARAAAATCASVRTHPVLVGPPGSHSVVLAAPFILYDHPQLAPESAGDLCDATEIDEILLLRTRALADAEKAEIRAIGGRAADIVARAEALPVDQLARMHGAARDLHAGEMVPIVPRRLAPGAKVVLRTPHRRTDAQDLLYVGRHATVVKVEDDVDGTTFYAVTIDDDPAAELHDWYGRYRYYRSDEVDPL